MNKIVYITARTPFSIGEEFILTEMLALKNLDADLLIFPRDRNDYLFHKKAEPLVKDTVVLPWFNLAIGAVFIRTILKSPLSMFRIVIDVVFESRNLRIALKNLIIMPKSVYLSAVANKYPVSHLHAHWGTTTSTMAYIISKLTGIPWSLTVHRGDIKENNLLKLKVQDAKFTRCISANSREMLISIVGDQCKDKIIIIPMGVKIETSNSILPKQNVLFSIAVPANLVSVKGHRFLVDACSILKKRGINNFLCTFYGDGILRQKLTNQISSAHVGDVVTIQGQIPHEELLKLYDEGKVDIIVLPSIYTERGDHEGIPVSLMEAMAYGIPVVSTNTGGIPELIGDGCGIMVEEKNPLALADAIEKLYNDPAYRKALGEVGRQKVISDFNVSHISNQLLDLFEKKS